MAYQSFEDAELRTQIGIACDIGVILESDKDKLIAEAKSVFKMLHALIKSLKLKP
jgi:four helix bundle protein